MVAHLSERDRALIAEGFAELARMMMLAQGADDRRAEQGADFMRDRLLAAGGPAPRAEDRS